MALQSYETAPVPSMPAGIKHHDIEFEIGALASRHGLSVDAAREIVGKCGKDLDCIDEEARKWKLAQ